MQILELGIWSDIACPWCYIGTRRLRDGIARTEGLEFDFATVRPANTAKAHELLHFAKSRGRQRRTSASSAPTSARAATSAASRTSPSSPQRPAWTETTRWGLSEAAHTKPPSTPTWNGPRRSVSGACPSTSSTMPTESRARSPLRPSLQPWSGPPPTRPEQPGGTDVYAGKPTGAAAGWLHRLVYDGVCPVRTSTSMTS